MKTKTFRMVLGGALISLLAINLGCNKSSSTGSGGSQGGSGSDYLPLTGNQVLTAEATYSAMNYDSTGTLVGSGAKTNQVVKAYIALGSNVGGLQAYQLFGYAQDGETLVPSGLLIAQDSQSVVLFQQIGQYFVLLPKNIAVGTKWVVNPFSPANQQVTLQVTDSKASYTNSAGKTFSNVIKVSASFSDSTISPTSGGYQYSSDDWYSWHGTDNSKLTANIDIYFAKGFGLVDAQMTQFDAIDKYSEVDSNYYAYDTPPLQVNYYSSYSRTVASGTCGRTDTPGASISEKGMQNPPDVMSVQKNPKKINLFQLLFGNHNAFHPAQHIKH